MRGSSCITCGHHPPGPRAAGSSGTGTLYQKQSKHQHINRVEVGVVVGEVDGEGGSEKNLYKNVSFYSPFFGPSWALQQYAHNFGAFPTPTTTPTPSPTPTLFICQFSGSPCWRCLERWLV